MAARSPESSKDCCGSSETSASGRGDEGSVGTSGTDPATSRRTGDRKRFRERERIAAADAGGTPTTARR